MKYISPMELNTLLSKSKDSALKLSTSEYRFLTFLLARVNKERLSSHGYLAWPGTEQITEYTGISKPTIERLRKSLVKAGWIQYTPGHGAGSSNHYYINAAKIVACYVESGNPPLLDRRVYETNVHDKPKKAHKRNTSGLKQGKETPTQESKPEPIRPVKEAEKPSNDPGPNPDGSPPFWPNGERRHSWDETMPPSNTVKINNQNETFYDDSLECPF